MFTDVLLMQCLTFFCQMHLCECFCDKQKLTLNQEEEAQDPSGGDDETRDDEGHSPGCGDKHSCDEGAQDVSH